MTQQSSFFPLKRSEDAKCDNRQLIEIETKHNAYSWQQEPFFSLYICVDVSVFCIDLLS